MTKIAIIGTAGRDKTKPMTFALWEWMQRDVQQRVPFGAHVVSGGAAWADHLAVYLFGIGHAARLTLHLPAPFDFGRFIGPQASAASAANYYHRLFTQTINHNSLDELMHATLEEATCDGTFEPAAPGYGGMFARNAKVARADEMLAYTFGEGTVPADGGTKDTWDQHQRLYPQGKRTHVSLPFLR